MGVHQWTLAPHDCCFLRPWIRDPALRLGTEHRGRHPHDGCSFGPIWQRRWHLHLCSSARPACQQRDDCSHSTAAGASYGTSNRLAIEQSCEGCHICLQCLLCYALVDTYKFDGCPSWAVHFRRFHADRWPATACLLLHHNIRSMGGLHLMAVGHSSSVPLRGGSANK